MTTSWRHCFQNWPKDVPPKGVVVTTLNEQIPFEGFLFSDALLLLERKTPDTSGARKVILSYESIAAVKLVDVMRSRAWESLGFSGTFSKD